MPGKPPPKKGGDDLDLSDVASLPKANIALFHIAFSKFKSTEVRQKIQEHVMRNFPEERIKSLTRQEIIDYGKSKGIIEEGAAADASSKGGLTYQQMLAQAAADRIFELTVSFRKAKKEKQIKLEEEAAAKAGEGVVPEKPETDNDLVDALVSLPDYPSTQQEHLAFSQYGHSINCFFEIYQVQENLDGTAPIDLKLAKDTQVSEEESEVEHYNKFMEIFSGLKGAIAVSAKNAPIRNCAIFRVPFCDVELVEFKENEEGE